MNEKIKISAVSYLNTLPFVYGIKNSGFLADLDYQLGLDNPADCAGKLIGGQVDIGLIPVAAIMEIHHPYILRLLHWRGWRCAHGQYFERCSG